MTRRGFMDRPLPSLADWIGDGARADGFEEWVQTSIPVGAVSDTPEERAALRLIKILSVATVEGCRTETDIHGREFGATISLLSRAAGCAVGAALVSAMDDDIPSPLRITKLITEEFRNGLKLMLKVPA